MSGQTEFLRRGSPLATNLALLLFGLITIEFCRTGVNEFHHFVHGYSETVFAQIVLYLGAISLIERCPSNKSTWAIVLAVAFIARLICIVAPPFLSTDIYRYVWDGKVQAAGINPFRYVPADNHLAFLRDTGIYPFINRVDSAHTIYPPVAQMVFFAVSRVYAGITFMKIVLVGFEAVTCWVLLRIFELLNLPRERIVLYAWHPLCFWEIASSGHIDAVALTFLTLAIYARVRGKAGATGGWLAAATLVKLYPAALLPAFFQRSRWRMLAVFGAIVAAAYACYSSVGLAVFGFLPGFAQEEGLESGTRYFLLALVDRAYRLVIPPPVYLAVCAALTITLCLWALRRSEREYAFIFSALAIATTLNVLYSPHYPWYFLWLLPYLAIVPWRPAFYLVTASAYLFGSRLGAPGEPMYQLNLLLYGGFALLLVCELPIRVSRRIDLRANRRQPVKSGAVIDISASARNL